MTMKVDNNSNHTQQTNIKKVLTTHASLASVASRSAIFSLTGSGSISSSARTLSSAISARSQSTAGKSSSVTSSRLCLFRP